MIKKVNDTIKKPVLLSPAIWIAHQNLQTSASVLSVIEKLPLSESEKQIVEQDKRLFETAFEESYEEILKEIPDPAMCNDKDSVDQWKFVLLTIIFNYISSEELVFEAIAILSALSLEDDEQCKAVLNLFISFINTDEYKTQKEFLLDALSVPAALLLDINNDKEYSSEGAFTITRIVESKDNK